MPLVHESPITLPTKRESRATSMSETIQREVTLSVRYYLKIYESPGTIIGKIVERDNGDSEIARIHLGVAEELKSENIYYPIRSDVIEGYQKRGIGTFLYDMLIQYLWNKDMLLVSGSLNNASKGLWESLRKQGRVTDRRPYMGYKYAMEALPKE